MLVENSMSDSFKGAALIALAIVLAAYINSYYSPYQSCIRAIEAVAANPAMTKSEAATHYCVEQMYGK